MVHNLPENFNISDFDVFHSALQWRSADVKTAGFLRDFQIFKTRRIFGIPVASKASDSVSDHLNSIYP